MTALRFSGSLLLRLTVDDTGAYHVSGAGPDGMAWSCDGLRLAPFIANRLAIDCPEAFDRAAAAALGFWANECEYVFGLAATSFGDSETRFGISRAKGKPPHVFLA